MSKEKADINRIKVAITKKHLTNKWLAIKIENKMLTIE